MHIYIHINIYTKFGRTLDLRVSLVVLPRVHSVKIFSFFLFLFLSIIYMYIYVYTFTLSSDAVRTLDLRVSVKKKNLDTRDLVSRFSF